MISTIEAMADYDLRFDPNDVGNDLVVQCWISQGPLGDDATFDPQPGDWLLVGDDEDEPLKARVTRRDENRVWVQVELPRASHAVA